MLVMLEMLKTRAAAVAVAVAGLAAAGCGGGAGEVVRELPGGLPAGVAVCEARGAAVEGWVHLVAEDGAELWTPEGCEEYWGSPGREYEVVAAGEAGAARVAGVASPGRGERKVD